jgi:hypothetical protein
MKLNSRLLTSRPWENNVQEATTMSSIVDWFRNYEFVAIWLEGIALVLIFVWDRLDAKDSNRQMVAQLDSARGQVKASLAQVEATHKPFLSFSHYYRDPTDALLGESGIVGEMVISMPEGHPIVNNIGSGPAINIRFAAIPISPKSTARPDGYLLGLKPGENFTLTSITNNILQASDWEIVLKYESLSGAMYTTKTRVNDLVLTDVKFDQVKKEP